MPCFTKKQIAILKIFLLNSVSHWQAIYFKNTIVHFANSVYDITYDYNVYQSI